MLIRKLKDFNPCKHADDIINISKLCIYYGVKDVIISSILPKRNMTYTKVIREVNDILIEKCQLNGFGYICNNNVTDEFLWRDGIHFTDTGTHMLASNFVDFLNYFILDRHYENYTDRI